MSEFDKNIVLCELRQNERLLNGGRHFGHQHVNGLRTSLCLIYTVPKPII